uniref:Uncharacterized protein n=1 Tax=Alexandrium monilatum TaxID=311494 RepID=A0A7S4Q8E7_9DINO
MERRIDPEDGVARTLAEMLLRYDGVYSRAEVEAYFRDDCGPEPRPAPAPRAAPRPRSTPEPRPAPAPEPLPGPSGFRVEGLEDWLREQGLEDYVERVAQWCEENGAISVEEVEENFHEIKGSILASEIEVGERVRVGVLQGRWKGQYLAEVLGTSESGLRLRHEQDDFVETLPWASLGGGKYRLEPLSDEEEDEEAEVALSSLLRVGLLRVDPAVGAGLEVNWVKLGYTVCKVDAQPGQPDLRPGDAIVAFGGQLLLGLDENEVERRFGEALADRVAFVVGPLNALLRRPAEEVRREAQRLLATV